MTEGENIIEAIKIVRELDFKKVISREESKILRRALNYNNPTAEWVNSQYGIFCGRCFYDTDMKTPFCPECGSKMEGWDE